VKDRFGLKWGFMNVMARSSGSHERTWRRDIVRSRAGKRLRGGRGGFQGDGSNGLGSGRTGFRATGRDGFAEQEVFGGGAVDLGRGIAGERRAEVLGDWVPVAYELGTSYPAIVERAYDAGRLGSSNPCLRYLVHVVQDLAVVDGLYGQPPTIAR
jgi:hypothetical protein